MKLLLLQTDIRWLAADENRAAAELLINSALADGTGVDLIVLPEMFATGFAVDPAPAAEPAAASPQTAAAPAGPATLAWMRRVAARYDAAVVGSIAVRERPPGEPGPATPGPQPGPAPRFFNRLFFVRPDGTHESYDKRHLFSFAGEHERYTPGTRRVVTEWRGWRILLQVCYDLRFPVFSRNGFLAGDTTAPAADYDMAIYAANWPVARRGVWDTLLRARAIENVCYVAGVNRVGSDPASTYDGGTALIGPRGETIAAAANDTPQALLCEADPGSLLKFRAKFPALRDADGFTLRM